MKRTKEQKEDCWVELNRAIKSSFKKGNDLSEKVGLVFMKSDQHPKKELSLVIYGINNTYISAIGSKHHWEIFLYKDGTWKIN